MNTQFIGYEYTITYDDYSIYKDLAQNIDEIKEKLKTKTLYEKNFSKENDFRQRSLVIGGIVLPLLAMLLLASNNYETTVLVLTLSLIISFSSEIVSRLLFYKTAVALGLAGNFFAGNQRG